MVIRPAIVAASPPRTLLVRVLAGFLVLMLLVLPAQAALLPEGFFDLDASPGQGSTAVEADRLSYDRRSDTISAEGNVVISYQGFTVQADRVVYNQSTGELHAVGDVTITDPIGTVYRSDSVEITSGFKEAFINSLSITTAEGALITARDVRYSDALEIVLTEASYSPCGLCIDEKGRRIGWKVRAARLVYDREQGSILLEQPSLEFLGIPVAWLPWFAVPDPTQPRRAGLRMPSLGYSAERGVSATVPFFIPAGDDIDIILSPTLMSRQGLLLHSELDWRLPGLGEIEVKASGLYQLDKSAFAGTVGFRDWRGAIQTAGRFTPVEHWTAGWSYSVFTDNAYLKDYALTDANSGVNQVYATHLSEQTWFDARIQKFNRIGNYTAADDLQQGMNLPKVTFDHVQDLGEDRGRIHVTGEVLGVHREMDQTENRNGVPYVYGYQGNKAHVMLEGAYENQFILPGGIAATPYLGVRVDGAWYDGGSALPGAPPASMLFSATPIAAMDVRWPLLAVNGADTHLVEPIAQLVYRGSNTTLVGITNDDAQSFVLDETNIFSFNRFSGIDRQETGLRANIGGHYLGSFADGSWLDLVAGQSFHLAGVNALGVADPAQVGTSTGLGGGASFMVAGARGGFSNGLTGGVKVQVDPSAWRITRAGVAVVYAPPEWFTVGIDYIYVAANPALGNVTDHHEITGNGSVKVADYWTVSGGLSWNLATGKWMKASTGLGYDDGYLGLGGNVNFTPTSWGFGVNLKLKGPDGELAF